MINRALVGVATAAAVVMSGVAHGADGSSGDQTGRRSSESSAAVEAAPAPRVKRGITSTASVRQTEEGRRYTVTAALKSPGRARSVTLQKFDPPDYSFEEPEWNVVRTVPVRGRARIRAVVVATDMNVERYRYVVRYADSRPLTSKPVTVRIWRWIPLSDYDPYYETTGTTFGIFEINGRNYRGFGPWLHSRVGSWEARFTPGRHCIAFKGVLGLDDDSGDGSSGTVALTADDEPVYLSPSLTPGMSQNIEVPLPKPYRIGVQLTDTTTDVADGDDIESYPSIGDPLLKCTGL